MKKMATMAAAVALAASVPASAQTDSADRTVGFALIGAFVIAAFVGVLVLTGGGDDEEAVSPD